MATLREVSLGLVFAFALADAAPGSFRGHQLAVDEVQEPHVEGLTGQVP